MTRYPLRVVSLFVICLSLISCGRKTPPKPLEPVVSPPRVQDLQAQVRQKGVKLTWSVQEQPQTSRTGSSYCFSIKRSELKGKDPNCPACPPLSQKELTCVDPAYPGSAVVREGQMSWVDEAVFPKHTYQYQITVQDRNGRSLSLSNPAVVSVIAPPPAPVKLTAASEAKGIRIHWQAPKKDAEGKSLEESLQFLLERRSSQGEWERISPIPVEVNSFLDSGVRGNELYDYRVTSLFVFEENSVPGAFAEVKGIKAPVVNTSPSPPHTVWIIPAKGPLEVYWTEVNGQVRGYHVYRREGKEITRLTADPVLRPPFRDNQVRKNAIYFYAISVVSPDPPYSEGLLSDWVEIKSHSF